jgi:hypothetical protein
VTELPAIEEKFVELLNEFDVIDVFEIDVFETANFEEDCACKPFTITDIDAWWECGGTTTFNCDELAAVTFALTPPK